MIPPCSCSDGGAVVLIIPLIVLGLAFTAFWPMRKEITFPLWVFGCLAVVILLAMVRGAIDGHFLPRPQITEGSR